MNISANYTNNIANNKAITFKGFSMSFDKKAFSRVLNKESMNLGDIYTHKEKAVITNAFFKSMDKLKKKFSEDKIVDISIDLDRSSNLLSYIVSPREKTSKKTTNVETKILNDSMISLTEVPIEKIKKYANKIKKAYLKNPPKQD